MTGDSLYKDCKKCKKPMKKTSIECQYCGTIQRELRAWHWLFIIIATLIFIGALSTPENNAKKDAASNTTPPARTASEAELPPSNVTKSSIRDLVTLEFTWTRDAFDTIMVADLTITNGSHVDIKDVVVRCTHFTKTGTKIDTNTETVYEVIKSNTSGFFPSVQMGFLHSAATKSSCGIKDFLLAK